jgi:hypothetical protein
MIGAPNLVGLHAQGDQESGVQGRRSLVPAFAAELIGACGREEPGEAGCSRAGSSHRRARGGVSAPVLYPLPQGHEALVAGRAPRRGCSQRSCSQQEKGPRERRTAARLADSKVAATFEPGIGEGSAPRSGDRASRSGRSAADRREAYGLAPRHRPVTELEVTDV